MRRNITLKNIIIIVFAAGVLFLFYSFFESYWLQIKKIDFADQDIPASFNNKKIVFISDIHQNYFFPRSKLRHVVEQANKMGPDIVILGGDYADSNRKYIINCFQELSKLNAKIAKFGVLGNHDYNIDPQLVRQEMAKAGFQVLDNQAQWLVINNEKIKISGVEDLIKAQPDLRPTIQNSRKDDFVILISHNPDLSENLNTDTIDLVLSGHTHGGQITFFGLWAPVTSSDYGQKYTSGLVDAPQAKTIVSRGVGTALLPLRFFSRPEIIMVNLVRQ